jgi:cellulose synthase/poly-beta-1,6-N-acetylglucosamine synthase-like glycosyltransferase
VLLLLANLIPLLDLWDLLVRAYINRRQARHPPHADKVAEGTSNALRPYALLVSVHNPGGELERFLEGMRHCRERVWVIDDASSDDTWARLERASIHRLRGSCNRRKPGALKELLAELPPEVETVLVFDPDTRILQPDGVNRAELEQILFEFQQSGAAAMCPRVDVRTLSILTRLQAFEYRLAFRIGRLSLGDQSVTAGIAVYRRDALARALDEHTLSVYAEDLLNTLILMRHGERIYYDERLVVETEGRRDWSGWFSQRVGWYFGLIKVYTERWHDVLRLGRRRPFVAYHYLIYTAGFTLLLHPVKLVSLALLTVSAANGLDNALGLAWIPDRAWSAPYNSAIAYVLYLGVASLGLWLGVERGGRWRFVPAVPLYFLYTLIHLLPTTVGYLNWLSLNCWHRRLYRDHFQAEASLRHERSRVTRA